MRRRRLLWLLLLVIALPLAGFLGLRLYLASDRGRRLVEAELARAIGGQVELGRVELGLFSTSLHELQVYLPGDTDTPTAAVSELRVRLPLWKLLDQDALLQHLTLAGAAVTLRFDKNGRILIEPPQGEKRGPPVVRARLIDARVTLRQEGKPDLVVQGIRGSLASTAGMLTLKAAIHDPERGDWTAQALVDPASGAARLQLNSAHVHVTQEHLKALPFVDDEVWREFTVAGTTPVELTIWHQPPERVAHYRVVLAPRAAAIHITSIDLSARAASGQVVIEDGQVLLQGVRGEVAGGQLAVEGDLDFRTSPERLRFDLKADGLDVQQLPRSWDLPGFLEGRIQGQAELGLTLVPGGIRSDGRGRGQVVAARIGGAAAAEPVALEIVARGQGFRFQAAPRRGLAWRSASDVANVLADTLGHAALPIARAGLAALDLRLPRPAAQAGAYLRFHVDLKEVNLGRFLAGIGIPLSIPIEGQAAIDVHVDLPIDTLAEPRCYRMQGTIRLPRLQAAELEFHDVAARLDYRDGVLHVADVTGRPGLNGVAVGGFRGSAALGLLPAAALDVNLRLDGMPLPRALADAQGLAGWLSGNLRLRAPLDRFGELAAWQALLQLDDSRFTLAGRLLALTADQVQLEQGVLSSPGIVGTIDGLDAAAAGSLALARPHEFTVDIYFDPVTPIQLACLADVAQLPVPIEGTLAATTRITGTLEPLQWQAGGCLTAPALQVNRLPFQRLELCWRSDGLSLWVDAFTARYGFGQVDGTAFIPMHGEESGKAEFQVREIDLAPLARQLVDLEGVEGRGFASIQANLMPIPGDGRRELTCDIQYHLPRLKVKAIAGDRLQGAARYDGRQWSYRCDGELLAGRLHVEGEMADRLPISRLTLEGAQLGRLRRELMRQPDSLPIDGRLDLELTHRRGADSGPQASGRLWLQQLRWSGSELADRIQADVQVRGDELLLQNASGSFCRGMLRGRAAFNTAQLDRSVIDLTLDRGEAQDLLVPWPDLARHVSGSVEARLQGTLGQPWRASGMVALARGRIHGVEVAEWRAPIDLTYSPSSGTGQLEVRDSHAQVARGRAVGQASYSWGHSNRLEARLRFFDVNLAELAPAAAGFNRLDGGTVSGRLDLAGTNVSSASDLTASLEATLKQTQAFEVPVFQQLAPYVAPRQNRRVPFETGDLKARLAHGVVHVERLRLTGGLVQLLVEGSLSLQGRLDLDVTGYTGVNAIQSNVARRLGLELPPSGPVPRSALARATSQLSARLVRLRVTGSVRNPQVQPVPLYQLTEEAVRFFLTGDR